MVVRNQRYDEQTPTVKRKEEMETKGQMKQLQQNKWTNQSAWMMASDRAYR